MSTHKNTGNTAIRHEITLDPKAHNQLQLLNDRLKLELHSASARAFFSGVCPSVTLVQPSMMLSMPNEKETKMKIATKRAATFVVTAGMMKPAMMMDLQIVMCQVRVHGCLAKRSVVLNDGRAVNCKVCTVNRTLQLPR